MNMMASFDMYIQKRRDRINQKIKALQRLVPNASKVIKLITTLINDKIK